MQIAMRSHYCGEVGESQIGQDVVLTGINMKEVGAMVFPTPRVRELTGLDASVPLADVLTSAPVIAFFQGVVDKLAETATGRLRAALDVTDPEPLPPDHPLWHAPGVLVAPHVGGAGDTFRPRMVRLLREQLTPYAAGAPLLHVVAGPGA